MFVEFDQGANKLQGCTADCTSEYRLQARYWINSAGSISVSSIESAVIVTSMNRFYQIVDYFSYREYKYGYQGTVFVGISFRDQKGITVTCNKKLYNYWNELKSTLPSLYVCGTETETSSRWIPVGGPIKGSYAVKNDQDVKYDYISDFGFYVEDPCQAFDNKLNINLNPTNRTVKDLKYHDGTESQFWLTNIC